MRIVLACATARGLAVLDRLAALRPEDELLVASFREQAHEPPFLEAIQDRAECLGATFLEASRLGAAELGEFWDENPFDLLLAVNWRYLIPPAVFRRARLGAFVIHDSLLPSYRGFSPTVWAMLNGEAETGVTLCRMEEEIDSGDIVDQVRVPIGPDETIATVMERLNSAYLELLVRNLDALCRGDTEATPQDESGASYTCKRLPSDNEIDWSWETGRIYNLIRATTKPYPGAYTWLDQRRLTVWSARRVDPFPTYVGRKPGRVVSIRPGEGSVVLTGDGALLVTELQPEGEAATSADAILNRLSLTVGRRRPAG